MPTDVQVVALPSVEFLQKAIHEQLCRRDRLDPAATPIRQSRLRRAGRVVGVWFQVEGPRLMRTYAIWVGDEKRVLFYDSCGERFNEWRLCAAPPPAASHS